MELIKVENNTALLNRSISLRIAELENKLKEIQEQEKELKEAILLEMQNKNIIKLETSEIAITYVDETTREDFDKKLFREQNPDLYDAYVKISTVKPSIRIKVK